MTRNPFHQSEAKQHINIMTFTALIYALVFVYHRCKYNEYAERYDYVFVDNNTTQSFLFTFLKARRQLVFGQIHAKNQTGHNFI